MPEKARSRAELAAFDAPAASPKWIRALAYAVVGIGVFSILACGYVLYLIQPTLSSDPEFAQQLAQNIIAFTPIEGYAPKGSIRWPLLSLLEMRAVYFEKSAVEGMLVVIEVGGKQLQGNQRVEKHLEAMLREKNGVSDALQVQPKVVKVDLKVQGQEKTFEMSRALDPVTNLRYRIIEGTVVSRNVNPVYIGLRFKEDSAATDADSADQLPEDVRRMLESIRG